MNVPPNDDPTSEEIIRSAHRLATGLRQKAAQSTGLRYQEIAGQASLVETFIREAAPRFARSMAEKAQAIITHYKEKYRFISEAHLFSTTQAWKEKGYKWKESIVGRHQQTGNEIIQYAEATEILYQYGSPEEVWEAFQLDREKEQSSAAGGPQIQEAVAGITEREQKGESGGARPNQEAPEKTGETTL